MGGSLIKELAHHAEKFGVRRDDALLISAAILVASAYKPSASSRALFQELAVRLPREDHGAGVTGAYEWLRDPGLSSSEWQFVDDASRYMMENPAFPVEWNSEVAYCLTSDLRHGGLSLSPSLAQSLAKVLNYPPRETLACMFPASASVAWELSEEREVTLYVNQNLAIILSLLSWADGRSLSVRRENPLDGSFMPAPYVHETSGRSPPFNSFDHIFSVPPFGVRLKDGPSKGLPFETYQIEQLANRVRKSFSTIIPDGALFRESKAETEFRAALIGRYKTTVLSLPAGMFWPSAGFSTNLLQLQVGRAEDVRLVDGRSMEKSSTGRVQEGLIAQHLERFFGLHVCDSGRTTDVTLSELSENGFSLVPDRYLKSGKLSEIEEALQRRPQTTLSDIAAIERGKAPMPLRELDEDPPLTAMEIAPSDLVDGVVRRPSRQQAFDAKERARVEGVTVRPGDILVSIKGNVGNFGMVLGNEPVEAEQLGDPWIVSQSLAIIRWKPNSRVPSPALLYAFLSAPWVREKLESMSGATTVRTLPISALRSLVIPVPTIEECARAEAELAKIAAIRERIAAEEYDLSQSQNRLWADLWHVPVEQGVS